MEFQLIDLKTWKRREYFEHYFTQVPCTYSMTVKLDITGLRAARKKLYPTLLYALASVVNRHEEFRTAINEQGQLGVFSELTPCYTVFHKDTETFSNIWTEYTPDYALFCRRYKEDLERWGSVEGMTAKPDPPANTFPVSMVPWASFEGFNLNLKHGYDYLLPIFTFGKYVEDGGACVIPLSIQAHHAVCDGFHTCRLLGELQQLLDDLGA